MGQPAPKPIEPAADTGTTLQLIYMWGRHLWGYQLVRPRDVVTIGPTKRADLVAPEVAGLPRVRRVLGPGPRGYRLRLWPGMEGRFWTGGEVKEISEFLQSPAPKRLLTKPKYREVDLVPGDAGDIGVDGGSRLRFQFRFVDEPVKIGHGRARDRNPLLLKTSFWTTVATLAALLVILIIGDRLVEDPPIIAITAERFARQMVPVLARPKMKEQQLLVKAAAAERKRKEREAAEARRRKEAEGKLGRADATKNETVLPKGKEDVLRERVSKTGLLALLGTAKASGSGLGKLLSDTPTDVEQAVNGLAGAKVAVGRGAGGLGLAGSGKGGGGTGFGHIQGSGDVDVGAGSGRGRKGPGLGTGKEKEVSVGVETGTPDAEGGLSREQITRVVRAHAAAVRYCYEKELQREPHLSGMIDLFWVIRPNGTVDRAKVNKATLESRNVQGCIERQVKNWQFPRSDAQTTVQSYPFFFKGGQ